MADCEIVGVINDVSSIEGTVAPINDINGVVAPINDIAGEISLIASLDGTVVLINSLSGVLAPITLVPGDFILQLLPTNGEQTINITTPNTTIVTALPLRDAQGQGSVQTVIVTLTAKAHSVLPTNIAIELLDDDSLVAASAEVFQSFPGGSSTIVQQNTFTPSTAVGDPLTDEEPVVNFSNTAERVFTTKGTAGSLALAINITAAGTVDYDFKVQVNGKKFNL